MKALSFALTPITQQDTELLVQLSGNDKHGKSFLNHVDRIPHVTLSMGFVSDKGEEQLVQAFEQVSQHISFTGLSTSNEAVNPIRWLHVRLSEKLSTLHQMMGEKMAEVRSKTGQNSAFHLHQYLTGREIAYVANFEQHSGLHYKPHVTLGYDASTAQVFPPTMEMTVGLFQLGPSCTCAKRIC